MPDRLRCCGVALALLSACSGTRGHDQLQGDYAFAVVELLSDPCGILAASGLPAGALWDGRLSRSGDWVSIESTLHEIHFTGHYRSGLEEFYADGTAANVFAPRTGQTCRVDMVRAHLDATSRTPTEFEGTLRVEYDVPTADDCACEMSVVYRATLR